MDSGSSAGAQVIAQDEPSELSPTEHSEVSGRRRSNLAYWLAAPGTLWMLLFLIVPLLMMVYVSFWQQKTFTIEPNLTLQSWQAFFSSTTYLSALLTTLKIWLIVLATTFALGYPTALYIGLFIRNKTMQTIVLVTCVIPFWTSFLIRVLAWRPMLGTEGAVNIVLLDRKSVV